MIKDVMVLISEGMASLYTYTGGDNAMQYSGDTQGSSDLLVTGDVSLQCKAMQSNAMHRIA